MANKKKGVSSKTHTQQQLNDYANKTHTQQQLNDYANQHNPNNKAYRANHQNKAKAKTKVTYADYYWVPDFGFGWCDD